MGYIIQNKATKDFVDEHGDWTMIRSFAKRFPSKLEAERYIHKPDFPIWEDELDEFIQIIPESCDTKSFRHFVEECRKINEAEYNKEWWDSKSDGFKKHYIQKHPNSIYAQKASTISTKDNKYAPTNKDIRDLKKKMDRALSTRDRYDQKMSDEGERIKQLKKDLRAASDPKEKLSIERKLDAIRNRQRELADKSSAADKKWGTYNAQRRKAQNYITKNTPKDPTQKWKMGKVKGFKDSPTVGGFLDLNDIPDAEPNKRLKNYHWSDFIKDAKRGKLPKSFLNADTAARDQVWDYVKAKTGMNDKQFADAMKKSITWYPGIEKDDK